jgi:5'-nucleotidase
MDEPQVLLTNDDGIDAVGFRALYDALSEFAEVTAVAPNDDRSAVGRAMSRDVEVEEHELGYAIHGTPADCTVVGLEVLCPNVDIVIAGCNRGANLGAYVLGRSGTVSAAVEAAFFDVPAIAVSLYVPGAQGEWQHKADTPRDYRNAVEATTYLVDHAFGAGVFEQADYLNVNAPIYEPDAAVAPLEITEPSSLYDMRAERAENGQITLTDNVWARMRDGNIPDPQGTDRRAIVEGRVSVSPLTAPHSTQHHEALDALAETYLS